MSLTLGAVHCGPPLDCDDRTRLQVCLRRPKLKAPSQDEILVFANISQWYCIVQHGCLNTAPLQESFLWKLYATLSARCWEGPGWPGSLSTRSYFMKCGFIVGQFDPTLRFCFVCSSVAECFSWINTLLICTRLLPSLVSASSRGKTRDVRRCGDVPSIPAVADLEPKSYVQLPFNFVGWTLVLQWYQPGTSFQLCYPGAGVGGKSETRGTCIRNGGTDVFSTLFNIGLYAVPFFSLFS